MYKDPDIITGYSEYRIKEEMIQWGEGARAEISFFTGESAFGHIIMAEIHRGHIIYVDPQIGKVIDGKIFNKAWTDMTKFFRTDDLQFNENVIECVKNRKSNDKRRSS